MGILSLWLAKIKPRFFTFKIAPNLRKIELMLKKTSKSKTLLPLHV